MGTDAISPLRQRMIEDMSARQLHAATQKSHIRACKRFAAFLKRSPDTATADDIRRFQLHLAESGSSICHRNRTMTGLRFLFRVTLRRLDLAAEIYHIKEPQKIPLVMSADETRRLLAVAKTLKARRAVRPRLRLWPARQRGGSSSRPAISTAPRASSVWSSPRGARTAMSCCRRRCSLSCGNGGRRVRGGTTSACRPRNAGCSLASGVANR